MNDREYLSEINVALNTDHTMQAVECYASLRRALVIPDNMEEVALVALAKRVDKATAGAGLMEGKANAAMRTVLAAYARYISICSDERQG